jgi:peptidoglycan/LPS O-acetylase OafA/YrhL
MVRAFLALSVYIWHEGHSVYGFRGMDGQTAVESFFVISGFYMFMILDGKYANPVLFLTNRLLRLYPVYLAVLVLTVASLPLAHALTGEWGCIMTKYCNSIEPYTQHWSDLDISTKLFVIVANLSMLFQDTIFYLGSDDITGKLYWTMTYKDTSFMLWTMMIMPQAWSISVELYFYVMVIAFHRMRTVYLLGLIVAGVAAKTAIYAYDMPDPWGDKFFPAELTMFLLGGLSYRACRRLGPIGPQVAAAVTLAFALVTVGFQFIPLPMLPRTFLYCGLLVLCLPAVFSHSGGDPLDRFIGDLSYPIYMTHQLVIFLAPTVFFHDWIADRNVRCLFGLVLTVLLAHGLRCWIDTPVDAYRQRRLAAAPPGARQTVACQETL